MEATVLIFLILILVLSIFLGFEIISKVPSLLHTPLMSGSNAISGVTIVGAIIAAGLAKGSDDNELAAIMGGVACLLAMVNVVGGYFVTDRMLQMFKKKEKKSGSK
jgi:NAD(P) transhydrogenase subunit alpha